MLKYKFHDTPKQMNPGQRYHIANTRQEVHFYLFFSVFVNMLHAFLKAAFRIHAVVCIMFSR